MKKTFLLAAFAATLALNGCNKNDEIRPYYWTLEVRNETSKRFDLIYWENGQPTENRVLIDAGQSGTITGIHHYGPDGNTVKLTDPLNSLNFVPFGNGIGDGVCITINGRPQPVGFFHHNLWGFKGDFYEYTYTLTVNNEFLEKLLPGYTDYADLNE